MLRQGNCNSAGFHCKRYCFNSVACTVSKITAKKISTSYHDAVCRLDGTKWQTAMKEEFDLSTHLGTWELISLFSYSRVIQTKWVFHLNRNEKGDIVGLETRLVAKGFTQIFNFISKSYVHLYRDMRQFVGFCVWVSFHRKRRMTDVKKAFVNSEVNEEIYVEQTECLVVSGSENLVHHL